MTPKELFYEKNAAVIIKNLEKRQMEGYYCATSKEAVEKACSFIRPGDTVTSGGSVTLDECGMLSCLSENKDITFLNRTTVSTLEEKEQIEKQAFLSDCYFMSTNAITLDGELLNIDGNGNRLAALIYGPKTVIIMTSMNKAVTDIKAAYDRVKNIASPQNSLRVGAKTPCTVTGSCSDCLSPDCICSHTVITRRNMHKGRIKVILIGENLGY